MRFQPFLVHAQRCDVCVHCTVCQFCNIELAFLLDSSTKSIGDAWTRILDFTSSVIAGYNISPNCVRASVISYSNNAVVSIELNRYGDSNSLGQAVRQLRLLTGTSNLATAFDLLRTRVFHSNVIRPNTAMIAVVVTDQIQPSQQLTNAANGVKSQGIRVIGVGINRQGQVNRDALYGVTTNNYAVIVSDYNQLSGAVSSITQRWGCFPFTPPTTTTPVPVGMCLFLCILICHCIFAVLLHNNCHETPTTDLTITN